MTTPRELAFVTGDAWSRAPSSAARLVLSWHLVATWARRHEQRVELRRLLATAPHLLHDIGLTPAEAEHEAGKPFWRA